MSKSPEYGIKAIFFSLGDVLANRNDMASGDLEPNTKIIDVVNYANSWAKTALVTNYSRATIDFVLEKIGLKDKFSFIVSKEDVKDKIKPHRWSYLLAAYHYELKRHEALCIESDFEGSISAIDAGQEVWRVSGCEEITVRNLMDVVSSYRVRI